MIGRKKRCLETFSASRRKGRKRESLGVYCIFSVRREEKRGEKDTKACRNKERDLKTLLLGR